MKHYSENWLSKKLRDNWPQGHGFIQSFELHSALGTPDLFVQHPRLGAFWLELKQVPSRTVTRLPAIPFRPAQPQWIKRCMEAGGKVYILLIVQRTQELWLVSAPSALGHHLGGLGPIPAEDRFCKLVSTLGPSKSSPTYLPERLLQTI